MRVKTGGGGRARAAFVVRAKNTRRWLLTVRSRDDLGAIRWAQRKMPSREANQRKDELRAEIAALAWLIAAVENQVHFLVPGYWRLGEMLEASSDTLEVKYRIAKGKSRTIWRYESTSTFPPWRMRRHTTEPADLAGHHAERHPGAEPAAAIDKRRAALWTP